MEASPLAPESKQPFQLEFLVSERRSEGTEEKPVLYYERNGFSFRAELDLLSDDIENRVHVALDIKRPQSFDKDWEVLLSEVQALAEAELQRRRTEYGEKYFS